MVDSILTNQAPIVQKPAENSRFDFDSTTVLEGVYLETPYPLLRIKLGEDQYKDIVLLGFGKSGALPYLTALKEEGNLPGNTLRIEGNLLYYNGKSLLQITDENDIQIVDSKVFIYPLCHRPHVKISEKTPQQFSEEGS